VHRRLWPALVAVAESGDDWQQRGLKADAVALLRRVRAGKRIPIDRAQATAATALERRLLAHATTEHTASGRHARFLETWAAWAGRAGVDGRALAVDAARDALTAPVRAWIGENAPSGILPWPMLA